MKQEEKELLLKDLCARLPYGVKCKIALYRTAFNVLGIVENKVKLDSPVYDEGDDWWEVTEVKPYLRPMSSMTEKERKHWKNISLSCPDWDFTARCLDWLNSHHLDYRGLIYMGIAKEVTKDNNPYE